jgi:hypothetical protein
LHDYREVHGSLDMKDDIGIRKQLVHIARKFGGCNLVCGAANALHDPDNPHESGMPSDYGIDVGRHVPINRAVTIVLSMTSRAKLREVIDNGELELWTSVACELDDSPQPLTGPVDVLHVETSDEARTLADRDDAKTRRKIEHWVCSHKRCLASFANLHDALEYVRSRKLELDKVCPCAHAAGTA